MLDFDTTQMLPESQTPAQKAPRTTLQFDDDDDLGLDLGMDPEPSIEIGRRAATLRGMTFSIVARSADGESWGVAVASKFLAVGSAVLMAAGKSRSPIWLVNAATTVDSCRIRVPSTSPPPSRARWNRR